MTTKNIGIQVQKPKKKAKAGIDKKSPFSGSLKARGRQFIGTVVSTKMRRSAVVEWQRRYFLKKYERYEKRMSKVTVHVPEEIEIEDGDMVRISECRPLSKTKNFVIIENMGKEKGFSLRMEGRQESKTEHKAREEEKQEESLDEGKQQ